jgi:hypothetical protein
MTIDAPHLGHGRESLLIPMLPFGFDVSGLVRGIRSVASDQGSEKHQYSDRANNLKREHRHLPSLYPEVTEPCDRSPAESPGFY